MFLQGSAGTGKTHTVRVILAELRRRHIPYLVSATTGIAAVQYTGGQTVHSLFSLGIDERQSTSFTSHVGRGTLRANYLLSAELIVIDEVSMLTPWIARKVSLTLGWIAGDSHEPWDFGGR
jgi:DNA helicase HerA-like ATPase